MIDEALQATRTNPSTGKAAGPFGVAGSEDSGRGEAAAYERFAGAAHRSLTGKWRRREPERTLLYATVRAR